MSRERPPARIPFPRFLLIATVLGGMSLAPVAQSLRFDGRLNALMPARSTERRFSTARPGRFRDPDVVIAIAAENVFEPELFAAMDRLTESIANLEEVEGISSPTRLVGRNAGEAASQEGRRDPRAEVLQHPLGRGVLAAPSGHRAVIQIRLKGSKSAAAIEALEHEIKPLLAEVERRASSVTLSGPAMTAALVARQLRNNVAIFTGAAVLIALLAAALSLRSLAGVVLTAVCIAVGLIAAVAGIALTGRPVTLPTAGIIPLLPLIGVAFPLYYLARVQQTDETAADPAARAGLALARLRIPLGVLATATLLGAAIHLTSALPALRDFGLFAALGVALMGMSALLIAPAGAASWLRPRGPAVPDQKALLHSRRIEQLGAAAVRHAGALIAAGCVLVAVAAVGLWKFGNTADFRSLLGPVAGESHAGSEPDLREWSVRVDGRTPNTVDRIETLLAIGGLQQFIESQHGVVSTLSIVDFVANRPAGDKAHDLPETQDEIDAKLRGAGDWTASLVDPDLASTRIQVQTRELDTAQFNTLCERIEAFSRPTGWSRLLGRQARFPPGISVSTEGSLVDLHRRLPFLKAEILRDLGIVALLLLALVSIQFLSARVGFFVVALNLLAMIVVVGTIGWTGVGTNAVTAPLPALLLGLAVGHTSYYFRALGADGGTLDCPTEALTRVVQSTGRPLTYCIAALLAGFATMALADAPALRWFGTLGAAGLALAFVANLFLLSSRVLNARIITVAEFLNTRLGRIEEIPLFTDMSPFQAKLVVLSGHLAKAERGATIARKGESSSELYLLLDGKADVRNGVDGPIVGAMKRGDVVGEMGLVRGAPRSADVVASEPVEYLVLDGDFLQRLRRQYPRTAAALLFNLTRILSDRLDRATGRISALEGGQ